MKRWQIFLLSSLLVLGASGWWWLQDEPLDSHARAWLDEQAAPRSDSRAYYQLLGMDAPLGVDTEEEGRKRLAAMGKNHSSSTTLPLPALEQACWLYQRDCLERLQSGEVVVDELLEKHGVLLQRYQQLLQLDDYHVLSRVSMEEPLPSYTPLMRGNFLLALRAYTLAAQGQPDQALEVLEEDVRRLRYWLVVADDLVLKMVLVELLSNDLSALALLSQAGLVPTPAHQPVFSQSERSLKDPLKREFARIVKGSLDFTHDSHALAEIGVLGMQVLYKPHVTVNSHMPSFRRLLDEAELGSRDYSRVLQRPIEAVKPRYWRNPVGSILGSVAGPNYRHFQARLHDLGAKVQLLNLSLRLPKDFSPTVESLKSLPDSESPYRAGEPPYWDAEQKSICYRGVQPDHAEYRCLPWRPSSV